MHVRSSNNPHAHAKVESDHRCGLYRDANNSHTKQLQITHANKNINSLSLLSCGIINLLESYLPVFIPLLTLKEFIPPDLAGVTLVQRPSVMTQDRKPERKWIRLVTH